MAVSYEENGNLPVDGIRKSVGLPLGGAVSV